MIFVRSVAAAAAAALVCAAPAAALPADFTAQAEAVLQSAYAADQPGAVVIVTHNGKPVFTGARGLADLEAKRPLNADSVFRIGSITKQFTAAVILQLAEEGRLSLDDPLSKFLSDYPKPGADATVEQLLNHTSGIKSYTDIPGAMDAEATGQALTTEQLIAQFKDHPSEFERGTRFLYNNSGYVLLGAIIEQVTGKPWHVAVEERLSRPLGLPTIRYGGFESGMRMMARGYTRTGEEVKQAQAIDMSVPHAAGALLGSVADLTKWNAALHGGKVVKPENFQRMIAPTKLVDGSTVPYGYGISNSEVRGRKAIGHGGGIFGFSTESIYLPEADLFVAVLANSDAPATSPSMVMQRIAALALGDPYPAFVKADVPISQVEPLLGSYKLKEGERLFFARDDKLYTRRTGGSESAVEPAGNDRFFYPASLSWFQIARSADGRHVMNMYQMGANEAELAVRAGPVPAEMPSVEVARATLERYVGDYDSPVARIQVRLGDDGRLTLQFGPQPQTPLIAVSETEFRPQGVDAQIIFEADGKSLRLRQGGRELPAKRVDGD